ncbi:lipoate--protein ligase [Thiotrichales bacterium 19S3-7]|nr:lipoate--protein ligase [Thiotrichales bacterium 19S3-7]MCF6802706.1 lipoate--protein ligase [Thiotrichales bacterium 19S3-11]
MNQPRSTSAKLYIQQHHNPFDNLSVEKYLFNHVAPNTPILYLWRNNPCVVIGRAQNPWLECNLSFMDQQNIPMVRRHSGGGTVFHDLNNLNFSFLSPPEFYDKNSHLTIITNALKMLDINTIISPRNDLLLPIKGKSYKISGSAYRESRKQSLHHGTLLIGGDVELLNQCIHSKELAINAKGVRSVRSEVLTLQHIKPQLSIEEVINAISQSFMNLYPNTTTTHLYNSGQLTQDATEIIDESQRLQSWQWRFGKTLPFEKQFRLNETDYIVSVKHGMIDSIQPANKHKIRIQPNTAFLNDLQQIKSIATLN